MFAWAARPIPVARWGFLLLNAVMIVATVPIGVHYILDVVAGLAVGAAGIAVANKITPTSRRDLPGENVAVEKREIARSARVAHK